MRAVLLALLFFPLLATAAPASICQYIANDGERYSVPNLSNDDCFSRGGGPPPDLPVPVSAWLQLADVSTTAAGITTGALIEGNGLIAGLTDSAAGFGALAVVKLGVVAWARAQPPEKCTKTIRLSNAAAGGAALNNLALIAGAASGGAAAVGIIGGALIWHYTADSAEAECANGVPALLVTARIRERIRSHR